MPTVPSSTESFVTRSTSCDHMCQYCSHMDVGVRELKSKLSEYLHRAAAGEDIVVCDRGKPVARLTAYSTNSAFERGIEEGWIEPARRTQLGPSKRHHSSVSVLDVLDEDRG